MAHLLGLGVLIIKDLSVHLTTNFHRSNQNHRFLQLGICDSCGRFGSYCARLLPKSDRYLRPLPCVHAPEPEKSGYRGYRDQSFISMTWTRMLQASVTMQLVLSSLKRTGAAAAFSNGFLSTKGMPMVLYSRKPDLSSWVKLHRKFDSSIELFLAHMATSLVIITGTVYTGGLICNPGDLVSVGPRSNLSPHSAGDDGRQGPWICRANCFFYSTR